MSTVKIERRGTSQKVPLPQGCQFETDEIEILRRGDEVVLREKRKNLREAFDILASMPDDFFADGRQDDSPQIRDSL
jgi:antitoxin VapB